MKRKLILPILIVTSIALVSLSVSCRGVTINNQEVVASRIAGPLPAEDPNSSLWDDVSEHPAKLMVQDVTEPKLAVPGIDLVRVRAMHDGNRVVFRLEWADQSQDLIPQPGTGSDAAAIQFPVQPGADVPDAAMGEAGKGVRIWYWKSLWQDDIERAGQGKGDRISALYPHGSTDHYPYNANPSAKAEMEKRYAPARAAGNPIAIRPGNSTVQVLMAEGFGNVSPASVQDGTGRGNWRNGNWMLTISRPLKPGQGMDTLEAGKKSYIAFAVWDGSAGQSGARKMRSGWVPLRLE